MSSRSILATALLASTAIATPLTRRNGPDNCGAMDGPQPYVANVRYYSDSDCTQVVAYNCLYVAQDIIDDGSGEAGCEDPNVPTATPYYAMLLDTAYPDVQLAYTADQSCPPSGAGAVFATLDSTPACVEMNKGGSAPGLAVYPNGGAAVAKKMKKRDPNCSGFNVDSQQASESQSVQISSIVDCTNSADAGCSITKGEQHTESVSTSYSLSAGGGVEGLDIGATFGMEYTSSETSSIQEGFTIEQGQKGYLSAYSAATLFKGTFTGCDSGDSEQPGEALVLKSNGFTYEIIYTSA